MQAGRREKAERKDKVTGGKGKIKTTTGANLLCVRGRKKEEKTRILATILDAARSPRSRKSSLPPVEMKNCIKTNW